MSTALIGHTGFVGSNLLRQQSFDKLYNSKNFQDLRDQSFDLLVCAGVSSVKWKANREPAVDAAAIDALKNTLIDVRARTMVLISTIDVYPITHGVDEDFDCAGIENHAYGTHRLDFEKFCHGHFDKCHIVRLPGLFGPGLKKNVIFDLMHDNCLDLINPRSSFQYYNLARLGSDIDKALASNLRLVNLFTEPLSTQTIIDRFFPGKKVGDNKAPEANYDLHSRHGSLWGQSGRYIATREDVLSELAGWLKAERN